MPPHLACGLGPKTWGSFTLYHLGITPPPISPGYNPPTHKNMSNTTSKSMVQIVVLPAPTDNPHQSYVTVVAAILYVSHLPRTRPCNFHTQNNYHRY